MSPSKALRIAMLKSRFAGTIVKAQQNALLDHVIFLNTYWTLYTTTFQKMFLYGSYWSCFDFLGEGSRPCKVAVRKGETGKKSARRYAIS